jgi:hypothetical protein
LLFALRCSHFHPHPRSPIPTQPHACSPGRF